MTHDDDTQQCALQPSSAEATLHLAVRHWLNAHAEVNYTAVQIQSVQFILYLKIDGLSNSTDETGPDRWEWFANPQDGMGMVFTFSLDPAGMGREWNHWNGTGLVLISIPVSLYIWGSNNATTKNTLKETNQTKSQFVYKQTLGSCDSLLGLKVFDRKKWECSRPLVGTNRLVKDRSWKSGLIQERSWTKLASCVQWKSVILKSDGITGQTTGQFIHSPVPLSYLRRDKCALGPTI